MHGAWRVAMNGAPVGRRGEATTAILLEYAHGTFVDQFLRRCWVPESPTFYFSHINTAIAASTPQGRALPRSAI